MKMEFDSEQVARYIQVLKNLDWELSAYRAALEAVGLLDQPNLTLALQSARLALQQPMAEKYDAALKDLLALPTETEREQQFSQLLSKWNPADRRAI